MFFKLCALLICNIILLVRSEYSSCYSTPIQSYKLSAPLFKYINQEKTCRNLKNKPELWTVECVDKFEIVQTYTKFTYEINGRCNSCKHPTCEIQHVCCRY